jgi:hypothetical protein
VRHTQFRSNALSGEASPVTRKSGPNYAAGPAMVPCSPRPRKRGALHNRETRAFTRLNQKSINKGETASWT